MGHNARDALQVFHMLGPQDAEQCLRGNGANQPAVIIDNGDRDHVEVHREDRDLLLVVIGSYRPVLRLHDIAYHRAVAGEKIIDPDDAFEPIVYGCDKDDIRTLERPTMERLNDI